MIRTAKQLEKMLQQLNDGIKLEVKKTATSDRITGTSTTYRLSVDHGKFYIAGPTFKDLLKTIERKSVNNELTMISRYGKQETMTIKVA